MTTQSEEPEWYQDMEIGEKTDLDIAYEADVQGEAGPTIVTSESANFVKRDVDGENYEKTGAGAWAEWLADFYRQQMRDVGEIETTFFFSEKWEGLWDTPELKSRLSEELPDSVTEVDVEYRNQINADSIEQEEDNS